MDFLNVGSGELILLLLLAILVVGPKRAAELLQQTRQFVVRLRREWYAVQRDFMAEVDAYREEGLSADSPRLPPGTPGASEDKAG